MRTYNLALGMMALAPLALAQFPPQPSGLTTTVSKVNKQVNITWKQAQICETNPGVKSYSGYVNLPGSVLNDTGGYDIHTYFMYFEARHDPGTAPLVIYLAGGPGEASSYAALASESGPCYVNFNGTETIENPWSFNNNANVLYIDQPTKAGLSYSYLVNGTYDLASEWITPLDINPDDLPDLNSTTQLGTFADQGPYTSANTTVMAGKVLWHFYEHWISSFPEYRTSSNKISFWGNSYGGFWIPETSASFIKHAKNLTHSHPLMKKNLTVDAIGITNGCMDFEYAIQGFPDFAYNNTYSAPFYGNQTYQEITHNITKPGGCLDLMKNCRAEGLTGDPEFKGNNDTVNEICEDAFLYCFQYVIGQPVEQNHSVSAFDVAIEAPDACPYDFPVGEFLNTLHVQSDLGLPLNWTWDSQVVTTIFGFNFNAPQNGTGDAFRQAGMPNLEYLLQNGVKMAFLYGDRDYRCPWTGAEATAKAAKWENQKGFNAAGYQELQGLSKDTHGGVVKQYGQLSFTRVFDSGHSLSAYAPETVFRVFNRTMYGKDVATGSTVIGPDYHTTGPTDSWGWRNKMPKVFQNTCIVEGKFRPSNPWPITAV
ncbi:uncharacterized protein Z518_06605 [Rhinocladiella mackenziei CBS 650.93]|uniref:Carboxypeptidase n=1 Tax=Rhinocladiella mackenziei CBS 650.93 TaxID=1442369 RepID=A0A0D2J2D5_9EURO|nr:uncharacterized protein Z518_06605 [Rhinocladiella mackenziei CBS 650.93]KIX03055.1 hypothetical protein Z518_06605 [Rhinocladiella mackenziei CBS 650.93]